MPKHFPKGPSQTTAASIDDATLLAIGRVVRACAELEDMLMLFICNVAGISQAKTVLMVGKMPVTSRLEIAERLAVLHSPEAVATFKACFDATYRELVGCRNDLVHGVLLGVDSDRKLAFLSQRASGVEGSAVRQTVASYGPEQIVEAADLLEERAREFPAILKIEKKRAARHGLTLMPPR